MNCASHAKAYEPRAEYFDRSGGMAQTNEDLVQEIQRLRSEINQLREIVNALFNAVFEEEGPDVESAPDRHDQSHLYN